nr:hypothetical protein [Tanacetum cinerariifolium]
MGSDTIQLENAVSTISQEYLLEFTSEYGIPEGLHPEFPGLEETIVDFSKAMKQPPTVLYKTPGLLEKLEQSIFLGEREDISHCRGLSHKRSERWDASSELVLRGGCDIIGPPSKNNQKSHMDLFNLISTPNPTKVKTGTRPRAAYEVPLLTVTASRVIDMKDVAVALESSGTPFTIEKSPLDFANEDQPYIITERVEQKIKSSNGTATEILTEDAATAKVNIQFSVGIPESRRSSSVPSMVGSSGSIYQPGWGVTNDCHLDAPDACQDIMDHITPLRYFFELRHLPNADFLDQYNITLTQQVAMGSQLRLRFEHEVRLLKKARSKIARRDQRIKLREEEIKKLDQKMYGLQNQAKNLKTLLEAEVDMKKSAEVKNAELANELDSLRVHFSDLQVSNKQLSEQMDARLDKLSVEFDEELYPRMLTAIAGRRWVIGHDLCLAVMKCVESSKIRQTFTDVVSAGLAKGISEGLKYGIEHGKAGLDLADVEAYDSQSNNKLVKALQDLKDLKYLMIDQLGKLKDAPMKRTMASLYLESDTEEDALQWIRDLRPSSSQLKIPVYPEVRDPEDLWAVKKEMLLEDAIAANVSRVEKKKKCRVVCRTHGIGFAHHARSNGIPVSVTTVP